MGSRGSRQFTIVSGVLVVVLAAVIFGIWKWFTNPDPSIKARALVDQDAIVSNGEPVGAIYLIPAARADITKPPAEAVTSCSGRYEWATEQGGLVVDVLNVRVTLTPWNSDSVVIDGVEVVPVERSEPKAGILAMCSGGGSSNPADPSVLTVNLSRTGPPETTFEKGDGSPADFVLELPGTETATFDVMANASNCDCSFFLRLTGTQNGEPVEFDVKGPDKDPFRVTSSSRGDPAAYDEISEQWMLMSSGTNRPAENEFSELRLLEAGDSACALLDIRRVQDGLGVSFVPSAGSTAFQPGVGPAGEDVGTALCSWTTGPADDKGNIPTFGLQHLIAVDAEAAGRPESCHFSVLARWCRWR